MSPRRHRERTDSLTGGVNKPLIARGPRAKRGRRTELSSLYYNCGIITKSELEAITGLRSLRQDASSIKPRIIELPSSIEGLRETSKRIVDFVGYREKKAVVKFCVPQVAHALQIREQIVKFLVDVFVSVGIVTSKEAGLYLWNGEKPEGRNRGNKLMSNADELTEFCQCLLSVLAESECPRSYDWIREQMARRLNLADNDRFNHQLSCVLSAVVAIGVLYEVSKDNKLLYSTNPPVESSSDSAENLRNPPSSFLKKLVSGPVVLDDKTAVSRLLLESVVQRIGSSGQTSMAITANRPLTAMQAAVVEITGNEVCHLGTIDVLGQGVMKTQNNDRTNSVIAVAVPQWMLKHDALNQQASRLDSVYMSCVPISERSLKELLKSGVSKN